jgi:sugar transferase (PEP-CTERM/EpsH1 system associated)
MRALAPKRPTLCHLLHSLHVGGAEMLAAQLARRVSRDFRVVFVCLDELGPLGETLRSEGFAVHVLNRQPGLDWRCLAQLGKLLRRERALVIHAHQYTPFFYALVARFLSGRPPILFTEHGRHFPDHRRPKRVVANRLLLAKRDRVIGVGEAVRQALITNEGIPADRVGVIYNGIDPTRFQNQGQDRQHVRKELGINASDLLIFQVARLDYLKDHLTAVRTLKRVVPVLPHARLLLVGDGPQREGIERAIADQGLTNHVRLLGTRKDVARLTSAADVFLLTSISEGIPLTLIEAMAASLPIVATRVGGVPEVVQDGVTGLLAAAGDDAALAEHLLGLASNRALSEDMGRHGRSRAHTMFSETEMVRRYTSLYCEMLSRRPAHAW